MPPITARYLEPNTEDKSIDTASLKQEYDALEDEYVLIMNRSREGKISTEQIIHDATRKSQIVDRQNAIWDLCMKKTSIDYGTSQ